MTTLFSTPDQDALRQASEDAWAQVARDEQAAVDRRNREAVDAGRTVYSPSRVIQELQRQRTNTPEEEQRRMQRLSTAWDVLLNDRLEGTPIPSTEPEYRARRDWALSTAMRSQPLAEFYQNETVARQAAQRDIEHLSFMQVLGDVFRLGGAAVNAANPTGDFASRRAAVTNLMNQRPVRRMAGALARGQTTVEYGRLQDRANEESVLSADLSTEGAPLTRSIPGEIYSHSRVGLERRQRPDLTPAEREDLRRYRHDQQMGLVATTSMSEDFGQWVGENIVPFLSSFAEIPGGFGAGAMNAWQRNVRSWRSLADDTTPADVMERAANILSMGPAGAQAMTLGAARVPVEGVIGAVTSPLAFTYEQEAGQALLEMGNTIGEDGRLMDPRIAGAYARDVGTINSVFEVLDLAVVGRALGVGEFAKAVASSAMRSEFRRITLSAGLRRATVGVLGTMAAEGTTEAFQEASIVGLAAFAQMANDGKLQGMGPAEQAQLFFDALSNNTGRILEAGIGGAVLGGIIGGVGSTITIGSIVETARAARAQEQIFQSLADGAATSELRKQNPAMYERIINRLTRGTPIEQVAINVEDFIGAFNQEEDRARAAATELGLAAAFDEAAKVGGEILIPMGAVQAKLAGTEAMAVMQPKMRLGPNMPTPEEAAALLTTGIDVERSFEVATQFIEKRKELLAVRDEIAQQIRQRLAGAQWGIAEYNDALAEVISTGYTTMAKAAGMDVSALPPLPDIIGPLGTKLGEQTDQQVEGYDASRGPSGQVAFQRDPTTGLVKMAVVHLTNKADFSTPIHEIAGHYFLELLRFLASQENATDQIKSDWQATLEWMGTSEEAWAEATKLKPADMAKRLAPYHEKFAVAAEVYFITGRAPSLRMQNVMRLFKTWLLQIYRNVWGKDPSAVARRDGVHQLFQGKELDPKIQGVFDRMFATPEEISAAADEMGGNDLIMTREEFNPLKNKYADAAYQRYVNNIVASRRRAEEALDAHALQVMLAENSRLRREAERRARRQVEAEMAQDPAWIANDVLTGKIQLAGMEDVRLNSALTFEMFPELAAQLPVGTFDTDVEGLVEMALDARTVREPMRLATRVRQIGFAHSKALEDALGGKRGLRSQEEGRSLYDGIQILWDEGWFGERNTAADYFHRGDRSTYPTDAAREAADARRSEQGRDRGRRYSSGGLEALPGAPRVKGAWGPDPQIVAVAERYADANGIPLTRQARYADVDPEFGARVGQAYEEMPHAPTDPAVQEAYANLKRQTRAQFDALVEAGYTFDFFDSASDPYGGNPSEAVRQFRATKHMSVYGTYDGYGTEGITGAAIENNPMLEETGLQWPDQNGVMHPVVANDLFRAVHDAFGHSLEGAGFRARGEENAWQAHIRLYTGTAIHAATTETRGQNSWLNFGPHGEANRTAALGDTVFAEQKTGLMPEWTWTENRVEDQETETYNAPPVMRDRFGVPLHLREVGVTVSDFILAYNDGITDRAISAGLGEEFGREYSESSVGHLLSKTRDELRAAEADGKLDELANELSLTTDQLKAFIAKRRRAFSASQEARELIASGVNDTREIIRIVTEIGNAQQEKLPKDEKAWATIVSQARKAQGAMLRENAPRIPLEVKDKIFELRTGGTGPREISRQLGLPLHTVWNVLNKSGREFPALGRRRDGERYDQSIIDPAEFAAALEGSKVVYGDGTPKRVFTGTSKDVDFKEFRAPRNGIWFTEDPEEASGFAVDNDSQGFRFNHATGSMERTNTAPRVIPAYLAIKNPKVLWERWPDSIRYARNYKKAQAEYFDQLKREGYDGVRMHHIWVAFDGKQVIHAIGSNLSETYDQTVIHGVNRSGEPFDIVVNPTRSDLMKMTRVPLWDRDNAWKYDTIRFIRDMDNNVYIAPGAGQIHDDIAAALAKAGRPIEQYQYEYGAGDGHGGWVMTGSLRRVGDQFEGDRPGIDESVVLDTPHRRPLEIYNQTDVQPPFFSTVERVIENDQTARASGEQWLATISKAPGVKREELDWIGLPDFLKAQDGPVAREDVLAFVRANGVQVEETVLGEASALTPEEQQQNLAATEEFDRLSAARNANDPAAIAAASQDAGIQEAYQAFAAAQRRYNNALVGNLDGTASEGELHEASGAEHGARQDLVKAVAARREALSNEMQSFKRKSSATQTRWSQYVLPGGENYRELLLRLPESAREPAQWQVRQEGNYWLASLTFDDGGQNRTFDTREEAEAFVAKTEPLTRRNPADFRTNHWGETPNILAHVRFNERVDSEGRRTLFMEEVQSDWHQGGRERGYQVPGEIPPALRAKLDRTLLDSAWSDPNFGYTDKETFLRDMMSPERQPHAIAALRELGGKREHIEALQRAASAKDDRVPDAPFKNNAWASLVLKRMIRWAAENGFDQIAWTRGQHQIDRGFVQLDQLFKTVRKIEWDAQERALEMWDKDQNRVLYETDVKDARLNDLMGADLANSLRAMKPDEYGIRTVRSKEDVTVGGAGQRAFYDRILPNIANDIGKRYGARVGETEIPLPSNASETSAYKPRDYRVEERDGGWIVTQDRSRAPHTPIFATRAEAEALRAKYVAQFDAVPETVHSLPITPELRDAAMDGMPLWGNSYVKRGPKADLNDFEIYRQDRIEQQYELIKPEIISRLTQHVGEDMTTREAWSLYRSVVTDVNAKVAKAISLRIGLGHMPVGQRAAETAKAEAIAQQASAEFAQFRDAVEREWGSSFVSGSAAQIYDLSNNTLISDYEIAAGIEARKRMLADPAFSDAAKAELQSEIEQLGKELEARGAAQGVWENSGMGAINRATDEQIRAWAAESGEVHKTDDGHGTIRYHYKTDPKLKNYNAHLVFEWNHTHDGYSAVTEFNGRTDRYDKQGRKQKPSKRQREIAFKLFNRMALLTRLFIIEHNPQRISFTGGSPSHEKLYPTMMRAVEFNGYTARRYDIVRANASLDEAGSPLTSEAIADRNNVPAERRQPTRFGADAYLDHSVSFMLLRPDIAKTEEHYDIPPTAASENGYTARAMTAAPVPDSARRRIGQLLWFAEKTEDYRNVQATEPVTDPSRSRSYSGGSRRVSYVGLDVQGSIRDTASFTTDEAINSKRHALRTLDRLEGWFYQNEEPPNEEEFLAALRDDVSNRSPRYRHADTDAAFRWQEAKKVRDFFGRRGIDISVKAKDLREQISLMAKELDDRGASADDIAAAVNVQVGQRVFGSGQEMLEAVIALPLRADHIRDRVKQIVDGELGELGENLPAVARVEMHNLHEEERILMELDAIKRATGSGAGRAINFIAKQHAARRVERMSVREAQNPEWALGMERRWAKKAQELFRKGDMEAAEKAKFNQLVHFHLFKEMQKASTQLDRALVHFKQLQKLSTRARISPDYYEQIVGILEDYELKAISGPEIQRRISLSEWVQRMKDEGREAEVQIDPAIIAAANRKPFQQLTVGEALAVRDAIQNIEHLGKLKNRLLKDKKGRELQEAVGDAVATINAAGKLNKKETRLYNPDNHGVGYRTATRLRKWHAALTKMEFLFRSIDGRWNGVLWNLLYRPFAEAADKKSVLQARAAVTLDDMWKRYTDAERKGMWSGMRSVPEFFVDNPATGPRDGFLKSELIAVALNLGNGGNVAALVDGFGWFKAPEGMETDYAAAKLKIIAALDAHLTQKDWEFVQSMWDLIGSFRDEAFDLHQRLTGLRPEAVDAEPVVTKHGTFRGGYYPLKFDALRDARAAKEKAKEDKAVNEWGPSSFAPMTKKGHLIDRKGSGGRPVKLDLNVAETHINNVVHDIAYREALIDANKVISHPEFRSAFIRNIGEEMYDQLTPWLHSIAGDANLKTIANPLAQVAMKVRGHMQIAIMGFKVATATQQLTGIMQAVPFLGPLDLSRAIVRVIAGSPELIFEKANWITSRSQFMKSRMTTFNRDVREALQRARADRSKVTAADLWVKENAFFLSGLMDWSVSSVVWTAAYEKALGGKVKGVEAANEEDAIAYADGVVRQTQSAGLPQDLPHLMRTDEFGKMVTSFYSYFSVLYNWTAQDLVMSTRRGRKAFYTSLASFFLIYCVAPVLNEFLAGRWDKEDETEEERMERMLFTILRGFAAPIPMVRDATNAIGSVYDYKFTPAESGLSAIIDTGESVVDLFANQDEFTESEQRKAALALGVLFGAPLPQAYITADYVRDYLEGEEEGFDFTEALLRDTR